MKTKLLIVLSIAITISAQAGSATWKSNPSSNDWNKATNWNPGTIPNGSSDIATFGSSNLTVVVPTAATEVNAAVFDSAANPYTISINTVTFTLSGDGVINNSASTQTFTVTGLGTIKLTNGASADSGTVFEQKAGVSQNSLTQLSGNASAGEATFINDGGTIGSSKGGVTEFLDNASAGNATFLNQETVSGTAESGVTNFRNNSTAASGTFTNFHTVQGYGQVNFFNDSSAAQGIFNNDGIMSFHNNATAADGIFHSGGGNSDINFLDTSTAADATFDLIERSQISFFGSSIAGNATFSVGGATDSFNGGSIVLFVGLSSASQANFIVAGATVDGNVGVGGEVLISSDATAGSATFVVEPGTTTLGRGGRVIFSANGRAGMSTITLNGASVVGSTVAGVVQFTTGSTADAATLIAMGEAGGSGGQIEFSDFSTGGTARVKVFGSGRLHLVKRKMPALAIGSIEGDGSVLLESNKLSVGSNNLSTEFSGLIRNEGSFVKTGRGTLTLSSGNLYTGGTTVSAGTLKVSNVAGSATGTGPVQVDAGTLAGGGIISGAVTIGAGGGGRAFLAPAGGDPNQATLTIQTSLTLQSDATYTWTFKSNTVAARADQVVANGVTINGATFSLQGNARGALPAGTVLTVISNTGANPIVGTFSNLADGAIVTVNGNNLQASYTGGDGNDLTLTVVP